MTISFSACHYDTGLGNHDNDYLRDDQSNPPLVVPAGLHMDTQAMNKTTLPPFNQAEAQTSIYPPNVLGEEQSPTAKINLQEPRAVTNGTPVKQALTVNYDLKHSWLKVGTALKKSGYRILDQDQASHSFYILDARGKGRALSGETSPLYCVQLAAKSAKQTEVLVMMQNGQAAPSQAAKEILNNIALKLR